MIPPTNSDQNRRLWNMKGWLDPRHPRNRHHAQDSSNYSFLCLNCFRPQQKSVDMLDIADDEYELVVEKLCIFKVPLLMTAISEDLRDRNRQLAFQNPKNGENLHREGKLSSARHVASYYADASPFSLLQNATRTVPRRTQRRATRRLNSDNFDEHAPNEGLDRIVPSSHDPVETGMIWEGDISNDSGQVDGTRPLVEGDHRRRSRVQREDDHRS